MSDLEEPVTCRVCGELVELNSLDDCEWCKNLTCKECLRDYNGQTICVECEEHHTGRRA
jgi:hypothetical protein